MLYFTLFLKHAILKNMKNISLAHKVHTLLHPDVIKPGSTIIIGFSGGPDSVALLHILNKYKEELSLKLIATHLDHGWRVESEKDAQFCVQLCKKWGVPIVVRKLASYSSGVKFNGSQEEFARKARRAFFKDIQDQYQASLIALGHHADDQMETFFIRLVRGASISGLSAMRMKQGSYIRPLLPFRKEEIIMYLQEQGVLWVHDVTNESPLYLRNRIRQRVLPALYQVDSRAYSSLQKAVDRLQKTEDFLEQQTQLVWYSIAQQVDGSWYVSISQFFAQQEFMRHRLIMHWLNVAHAVCTPTEKFFKEIERFLLYGKSNQHIIHAQWLLSKKNHRAWIKKNS